MAILPSVARSSRKATWRTVASRRLAHCVSDGRKAPSASRDGLSGGATALPEPMLAHRPTSTAAAIATPPAATHRRFRLRRVLNEALGSESMSLAVLSDVPGDQTNLVLSDYANLTGPGR